MDKEKIRDLINKYEQGESSLQDEQIIFDHAEDIAHPSQAWYKFIQGNRRKAPEGLQDAIWESIDKKRKTKLQKKIGIISMLICIILMLWIINYRPFHTMQSDKDKEALLKEAYCMLENEKTASTIRSIYEDDMIIIYASVE